MTQRRVFYPVSLNLVGRKCIVIGAADDREAIEKYAALEEAGADVRWITDVASLDDTELRDAFFVISTPQDQTLSAHLRALADEHRFLLCCIDQPKYGFVAMAAIVKSGPVRIAISTAGLAPRVGKILKEALQRVLDSKFARFIAQLATMREETQREHPSAAEAPLRRKAMIEAADGFGVEVHLQYPKWFEDSESGRAQS
jgi:precorrin-2 dehydrogenase / sirohydrochlorin ferrochelatase